MFVRTLVKNAMYYGGTIMEKRDNNENPTGEYGSYLSFVQVNQEKNKLEQVLVTYEGDITKEFGKKDGTTKGAGLVAGQLYDLDLGLNISNEKDSTGKAKAVRHILYGFTPATK